MDVAAILKDKGRQVTTARPDSTLREIIKILNREHIGVVVIRGKKGALEGIVSERDVVRGLAEHGEAFLASAAKDVMTQDVRTCSPADSVRHIMAAMTEHRIRHIPVVDGGDLCGIVSIGDVVKRRLDEIESEAEALREYVTTA